MGQSNFLKNYSKAIMIPFPDRNDGGRDFLLIGSDPINPANCNRCLFIPACPNLKKTSA
jgi:hypothetical protein